MEREIYPDKIPIIVDRANRIMQMDDYFYYFKEIKFKDGTKLLPSNTYILCIDTDILKIHEIYLKSFAIKKQMNEGEVLVCKIKNMIRQFLISLESIENIVIFMNKSNL